MNYCFFFLINLQECHPLTLKIYTLTIINNRLYVSFVKRILIEIAKHINNSFFLCTYMIFYYT